MASYFEEHDCEPGAAPGDRLPSRRALLELARSLFHGLEIDVGALRGGDWEHRLPPPAARRAVEGLPEVRVSAPQAGSEAAASAPTGVSPWRDVHVTLQRCLHLGQQGFSQLQRAEAAFWDKERSARKWCPYPSPRE
ncbi:hypothetical protein Chor_002182 [Crotalus horridus]